MSGTAHQVLADSIRQAIMRGELQPGAPVRADAVAERFGVSRIPVREALRMLEAEGLVRSEPHKGVMVAEISAVDLHEIYLLRGLLETEAVRRAVGALSRETLAELQSLVERMDDAVERADSGQLAQLNRVFHFSLYAASGLERLTRLIALLWNQSDAYRAVYLADEENCLRVQREHKQIVRAAEERDTERVVRLLDEHRAHTEEAIAAALRNTPRGDVPAAIPGVRAARSASA